MKSEKHLEFRGIQLKHLIDYVKELNGVQLSDTFPINFEGNQWRISIIKEEEVKITSTFIVNAVHIVFRAETDAILQSLLKDFRKKTTRVGG
ncbi:hypothetical protein [Calidifontibacillus oryziterrae]|uniref:hypothetical protein n=1 Tax=Calidifontibacillus oryziterrae TaxID=1191699 RepID=UPI0002D9443F|nr:hypothetical protein [Calidifontibacillus oryziterrae]